jgi:isocitrate dehydrogenase kinase/phosphatase
MATVPMTDHLSDSRIAALGAKAILSGLDRYTDRFRIITRRARIRFDERDWGGMQLDAADRLDLYGRVVSSVVTDLRHLLADRVGDRSLWAAMKAVYSGLIEGRDDWDLAETFFNSATRKIFSTVGVDPRIEFVDTDFDTPPTQPRHPLHTAYRRRSSTTELVEEILTSHTLGLADPRLEAQRVAQRLETHLRSIGALQSVERAEMIDAVFYRGQSAHLIGRLFSGSHLVPFVMVVLHPPGGPVVDAVLLTENQVSILFSFTRAYFHVDVERPHDLVDFLRTLMPRKRLAELYTSLGHNKHGKTVLYRELIHHLARSGELFERARGAEGLVMTVFTMPGFDIVFKVINDSFPSPKTTTPDRVRERYRLVFRHDRVGRLVDAQEFELLEFERDRFSTELLEKLEADCSSAVAIEPDRVVIRHAYVERRVIPLDIYVREADPAAATAAMLDYGTCIEELAAAGIFPGDLLLKNFGVTRHGRVVFYDYDELARLEDCRFRELPAPDSLEEEMAAEPWFAVGPNDVFPEEFRRFVGIGGAPRLAFEDAHHRLFDPAWWCSMQERVRLGELIPVFPYEQLARL